MVIAFLVALAVVSEYWGQQCVRLKVTVKSDNCGEGADCTGKGVCYSNKSMEGYECQCCPGFSGPHCEEIDACTPSPCTNNGICVDLSQGHDGNAYQCLCPYGEYRIHYFPSQFLVMVSVNRQLSSNGCPISIKNLHYSRVIIRKHFTSTIDFGYVCG